MVTVLERGVETTYPSEEARFVADFYTRYCSDLAEGEVLAARGCIRGAARALLDTAQSPKLDPAVLGDASAILMLRAAEQGR